MCVELVSGVSKHGVCCVYNKFVALGDEMKPSLLFMFIGRIMHATNLAAYINKDECIGHFQHYLSVSSFVCRAASVSFPV